MRNVNITAFLHCAHGIYRLKTVVYFEFQKKIWGMKIKVKQVDDVFTMQFSQEPLCHRRGHDQLLLQVVAGWFDEEHNPPIHTIEERS